MKSPLDDLLVAAGAWYGEPGEAGVPDHFGDPQREYEAARHAAGLADRSLESKLELRGRDRARFLHNLCTNDIKGLAAGRTCEAFVTNVQGKILVHIRVWAGTESLWVDTVPGAATGLLAHFNRYLVAEQVELADRTAELAQLLIVGPKAGEILAVAAGGSVSTLVDREHSELLIAASACAVLRDDALGLPGYELRVPRADAAAVWQAIESAGRPQGLRPIGARALETLRVEAGVPLYGVDIDDSNFPQEVGRDSKAISFTKGCYLGQETVARIDALGHVNRHLVGLEIPARRDPPPRGATVSAAGKTIGQITSAIFSPALGMALALGYVRRGHEKPGTSVLIDYAGDPVQASVRTLPVAATAV